MDLNEVRADMKRRLDQRYDEDLRKLNAFVDLMEKGCTIGPNMLQISIPNESINGLYMITTVDPTSWVISLKPMARGEAYIRNLVELYEKHYPDVQIEVVVSKEAVKEMGGGDV